VRERAARLAPLGKRVCLIGPECTGKTTLAERLADHFGVGWVAEFAREYALRVSRLLTVDDVEPIARGQMALEDAARQPRTDNLLILDTDLISTVVYATHYYATCPEWIETEARARKADFYLLTDVDVPWAIDDVRDSAAPRETLHRVFATTLATYGADFVAIRGDRETRFAAAVAAIAARGVKPSFFK
jgi:NadR type nicotinamide-nucleotide adenylyltransferase